VPATNRECNAFKDNRRLLLTCGVMFDHVVEAHRAVIAIAQCTLCVSTGFEASSVYFQISVTLKEWDIPYSQLEVGEIIGVGRFGTVYKLAVLSNPPIFIAILYCL